MNRHPDQFHLQLYSFQFLNLAGRREGTIRICRQRLSDSKDDWRRFLYSVQLGEAYQALQNWVEAVTFLKLATFLEVDFKDSLDLRSEKRWPWPRPRILDNLYAAMRKNGKKEESVERWVWFFNMQRAPLSETERDICGVSSLRLEPSVKWVAPD